MRLIAKYESAKFYLKSCIDLQVLESDLSIENLVSAKNDEVIDVYVIYRRDIEQICYG